MKILSKGKDGGEDSHVWGYWLIEIKSLFSIAILRFDPGSRDAFHNHAFNAISWVIYGILNEEYLDGKGNFHYPSLRPIITKRETFHKVSSIGVTWAITFRGPWSKTWKENIHGEEIMLTHGRKQIK